MQALLQHYLRIAFLVAKPQDLPAGARQLQTGIVLSFVTYVIAVASSRSVGQALLHATLEISLTALVFYAGLAIVNRSARFAQAFGGLCGASAVINIAAVPIFMSAGGDEVSTIQAFAQFFLLVWSLSLLAHVVRHTFETGITLSVVVSFVFYLVLIALMEVIFPTQGVQTASLQIVGVWMV